MTHLTLIIGNKNYSSWSLRAWLLLKGFDIQFDEQLITLFDPSSKPVIDAHSPTGKVPVLLHSLDPETTIKVSDSLAIASYANDYLADKLTGKDIWSGLHKTDIHQPKIQKLRAYCQSIVAQMHSGFMGVRSEMPMNIRATARIIPSKACLKDLSQIENIFERCLTQFSNPDDGHDDGYLLGHFTVADAFYAPVVLRLQTYAKASGIQLRDTTQAYCKTLMANTHLQSWIDGARQETWVLEEEETGEVIEIQGVLAK